MAKPIDFAAIEEMMADPDQWYQGAEAEARMDAALKKALNVTGPRVAVIDLPNGAFRLDIDFDDIVTRDGSGRDQRQA